MFEAWGRILYRRRRLTLVVTLVLVAFAAVWGTGVFGKLSSGNDFTPPASQSQREVDQAAQVFGRNDADVVVLYRSATMTVERPGLPAGRHGRADRPAARRRGQGDDVLVQRIVPRWSRADRHATYAAAPAHRGRRRRPAQDLRRDQGRADPAPAWPPPA